MCVSLRRGPQSHRTRAPLGRTIQAVLRLALVGLLLASNVAVAGPCDPVPPFQHFLTRSDETIDQLGGVVVANPGKVTWEFSEGPKRERARVTVVAPGLSVLAPKSPDQVLQLEDGRRLPVLRVKFAFQATDDAPIDAAPTPTAIVHKKKTPSASSEVVFATLAEPPPAGTVALLVRDSKATSARSWIAVTDLKAKQLDIYRHDRCELQPPGTRGTKAGDKIMLAWIDSGGHVSLWTAAIEVTAEK